FYTEYSAMKMGLFMFAEFIEIAIVAALFTTLFLGGYNLPFMTDEGFVLPGNHVVPLAHGVVVAIQLVTFLAKVSSWSQRKRGRVQRMRIWKLDISTTCARKGTGWLGATTPWASGTTWSSPSSW